MLCVLYFVLLQKKKQSQYQIKSDFEESMLLTKCHFFSVPLYEMGFPWAGVSSQGCCLKEDKIAM